MNNTESPQATLQHYFDDLLCEAADLHPAEPLSLGSAQLEAVRLKQVENVDVPVPQFAEPEAEPAHRTRVDRERVEKLLQSIQPRVEMADPAARTLSQPLVDTRVKPQAPVALETSKVEVPVRRRVPKVKLPEVVKRSASQTAVDVPAATLPSGDVAPTTVPRLALPVAETAIVEPIGDVPGSTVEQGIPETERNGAKESKESAETGAHDHPSEDCLDGLQWQDNGRPSWAQDRFDVLLFTVSGLTLAVPLIALGQIQPLNDELTPIFGQADWFMGLQPTSLGKIRTVNTAKFVMPERYDERFLETAQYVISIDGLPWGLAVDSVNQPITLNPDDVKWRSERSKRAWLAGTVKQHMCALLDIPMMGRILQAMDKNHSPVDGG